MHLSNLEIVEPTDGNGQGSAITNAPTLELCAAMLQLPPPALSSALISKQMGGGVMGDTFQKPLEPRDADNARKSLCMHLYSLAFDWAVEMINVYISRPAVRRPLFPLRALRSLRTLRTLR